MGICDLDAIVKIHQKAFQGFFLTRMGPRFLRAYYQTILDFGASIALVAYDSETDRILGFATGFRDPQGFYALLSQRRKRMLPVILMAVLRDPGLLRQILRNLRRVGKQASQPVDAVELSSIAVGAPGGGIGSLLLETFAERARLVGAHKLVLTTDAEGNDAVCGFYEGRGFVLEGYEYRGERRMCRYERVLG